MNNSNSIGRTILLAMSATLLTLQLSAATAGEQPGVIREVQIIGGDLTDEELKRYLEEALAGRTLTVYVPPPRPELPDLVLDEIRIRSALNGSAVEIQAQVTNAGLKPVGDYDMEVSAQVFQYGTMVGQLSLTKERFKSLEPGDTRVERFNTLLPLASLGSLGADVFATVHVDPEISTGGRIREGNEYNNHKSKACALFGSTMPGAYTLTGC